MPGRRHRHIWLMAYVGTYFSQFTGLSGLSQTNPLPNVRLWWQMIAQVERKVACRKRRGNDLVETAGVGRPEFRTAMLYLERKIPVIAVQQWWISQRCVLQEDIGRYQRELGTDTATNVYAAGAGFTQMIELGEVVFAELLQRGVLGSPKRTPKQKDVKCGTGRSHDARMRGIRIALIVSITIDEGASTGR
ncbi:hypothetical protein C8R43DRAFT_950468 [Mycena crocata]|nr:hypothetical protein C8R43DRAFT_950468 [Mycena crocata]